MVFDQKKCDFEVFAIRLGGWQLHRLRQDHMHTYYPQLARLLLAQSSPPGSQNGAILLLIERRLWFKYLKLSSCHEIQTLHFDCHYPQVH